MAERNATLRITIDGPAGAGKSTVARELAQALGYMYIDTGAMYRAITLKALQSGISPDDHDSVVSLAESTDIRLVQNECGKGVRVLMDGRDVTRQIRSPEVNLLVSSISAIPGVRRRMVDLQREMARRGGVVMEGRDTGSVVLPDAEVKVYLDASQEERARRRVKELKASGYEVSFEEALAEVKQRDYIDSSRAVSPLVKPKDAIVIDSTSWSVDEVVRAVVEAVRKVSETHV